jgi:hypothetical protein
LLKAIEGIKIASSEIIDWLKSGSERILEEIQRIKCKT